MSVGPPTAATPSAARVEIVCSTDRRRGTSRPHNEWIYSPEGACLSTLPASHSQTAERERETGRHRSELGERGALSEFRASGMNLLAEQNHSSELIQLAVAATGSAVYVNQQRESSSPLRPGES